MEAALRTLARWTARHERPDRRSGWLRLFPGVTVVLFVGPILAGILGTILPAWGLLSGQAGTAAPSLAAWDALFAEPALGRAVALSAGTGVAATVLSVGIVALLTAALWGTRAFKVMRRLLSPLLSVPHAAVALSLAFLIAPSGWLMRLTSPGLTGFEQPPDWAVAPDPWGLSLVFALVVKELPFLLLMTLAALNQVPVAPSLRAARALGYGPAMAWLKVIWPQLYPQIRLPIYAVLAYSVSVVDMALIIGPSTPPTLSVLIVRWYLDPEISHRLPAAAGALLQALIVLAVIGAWAAAERGFARFARWWTMRGGRGRAWHGPARLTALVAGGTIVLSAAAGTLAMALWSVARQWRFPEAVPGSWTTSAWQRLGDGLAWPLSNTITLGLAAASIAIVLTLGCLEHEQRAGLTRRATRGRAIWLLYTPLLVPQVTFLFGAQTLMVALDVDGLWWAVVWTHLLFVLPYCFLSLSDPYRALDPRYARTAQCLGQSPNAVFWRVKVPMLLRPILTALAVGFAVSCAQYLATLAVGAGRLPTLTTEAVSLAAGGNRRTIGVYVLLQTWLPFIAFGLAGAVPAWLYRNRRALRLG